MKTYFWILFFALLGTGCESLEDTYSDYAGDGTIRYLGMCSDLSVTPGWKRLVVKWTNNVDPVIDKIKVTWKLNDKRDSLFLDVTETECNIPELEDGNYEISVTGIDKKGNTSLPVSVYGRPYTSNHEVILSFTRLVTKHYFVKNRLIIFWTNWQEGIETAELNYYLASGEPKNLPLTKKLLDEEPYYLLPDEIDLNQPVTINRTGRVEGCKDLIVFDPHELSHEKLYTSDFKQIAKVKYGQQEVTDAFVNGLEELEYDYTMTSFEDILNLPNLKKLVLGKNRYLKEEYLNTYTSVDSLKLNKCDSELYEEERSLFALKMASQLNGLKVERYNQHYLSDQTLSCVQEMGNPVLPELACLDASEWKFTCKPEDEGIYDSYLENLFDGDVDNWWQPEALPGERSHEIIVDFGKKITINGVKIVQKSFDPKSDKMSGNLLPSIIKVKVSSDKVSWRDAMNEEENTLGATNGETTILRFPSPLTTQYLQFIVNDNIYGNNFSVALSEIGIF